MRIKVGNDYSKLGFYMEISDYKLAYKSYKKVERGYVEPVDVTADQIKMFVHELEQTYQKQFEKMIYDSLKKLIEERVIKCTVDPKNIFITPNDDVIHLVDAILEDDE